MSLFPPNWPFTDPPRKTSFNSNQRTIQKKLHILVKNSNSLHHQQKRKQPPATLFVFIGLLIDQSASATAYPVTNVVRERTEQDFRFQFSSPNLWPKNCQMSMTDHAFFQSEEISHFLCLTMWDPWFQNMGPKSQNQNLGQKLKAPISRSRIPRKRMLVRP